MNFMAIFFVENASRIRVFYGEIYCQYTRFSMMDWLFGGINDWIRQLLIDSIMARFSDIFDSVNLQVGEIAIQVGQPPHLWNV